MRWIATAAFSCRRIASRLALSAVTFANSSSLAQTIHFDGKTRENVAVTLTDLPGGFFGSLATKCFGRRLSEIHLSLSQQGWLQGWLRRSQLVC